MSIDKATPQDWDQARDRLASNNQVGGDHYNKGTNIEPIDYIVANNIGSRGAIKEILIGV